MISKVIIPIAGLGTRMLPASKAIPKEMFPVFKKPIIQYVVEEALEAGLREIIFITHCVCSYTNSLKFKYFFPIVVSKLFR